MGISFLQNKLFWNCIVVGLGVIGIFFRMRKSNYLPPPWYNNLGGLLLLIVTGTGVLLLVISGWWGPAICATVLPIALIADMLIHSRKMFKRR